MAWRAWPSSLPGMPLNYSCAYLYRGQGMSADAKLSVAMITAANLRSICPQLVWLPIGSLLCSRSQFRCAYGAATIYKTALFSMGASPTPAELLIIFNLLSRRDYSSQDRAKPRVCRSLSWRHRCLPCLVGGSEQLCALGSRAETHADAAGVHALADARSVVVGRVLR